MLTIQESWVAFVQQLRLFQANTEIDLPRICLDFRLSLAEFLKEQGIAGSSEDLDKQLTQLHTDCPLPVDVQFLKQIEGINIALVDYSRLLFEQDNESWELIESEIGHTTGWLNQLTMFIANELYPSAEERLENQVPDSSQDDKEVVKRFADKLLADIREIKSDLELLNSALENEEATARDQFIEFWTNPTKAQLACSLLASDEALCRICFDNYKNFFLQLIEQVKENQAFIKPTLNTNFLSFFVKQQSFSLIERSKKRFLQSKENITLLNQQQSEINNTEALEKIAANLDVLGSSYQSSLITRLVDKILKIIFCDGYDSRPQTVREAQDLRDIIYYLEEHCTTAQSSP
ncbi:hypothetical protein Lnau_0563 [Legionella nautarum]|uniref:Uncharacterized protein n=1 Tax=Legionella nautarum TaxID=45070 RepID=A0A0W0X1N0_9GAMM|nr:hypothetical protein [Legionella nautarum]KTD38494.1 hypothetical protein Lnau_0563 [Legionella nautarum]